MLYDDKYDRLRALEQDFLAHSRGEKPRIGYLCLRTPVELIEALGAAAVRIIPRPGFDLNDYGSVRPDGCSFCRMIPSILKLDYYRDLRAVIGGACCDQNRRIMDTLRRELEIPVLLYGAPRVWGIEDDYYREEMKLAFNKMAEILKRKLGDEKAQKRIRARNELRREIRRLREADRLPSHILHWMASTPSPPESVLNWLAGMEFQLPAPGSVRLMLAGSVPGVWELEEIMKTGAAVTADATCIGDRAFHPLVSETGNPHDNLYDSYIENNLCPHRRPQNRLIDYMKDLAAGRGIDGVIYLTLKYCHPWGLAAERMKTELNLPFLRLDDDLTSPAVGSFRTRVGAFVEMLKWKRRRAAV